MTTAYFQNMTTTRVHRGFLRVRGAKLFCGVELVGATGLEYRPKGDRTGPTFARHDEDVPDGPTCGRCFS